MSGIIAISKKLSLNKLRQNESVTNFFAMFVFEAILVGVCFEILRWRPE